MTSRLNSPTSGCENTPRTIKNNVAGAGIVVLFMVIYMLPLGVRPMIYPDESRYAEIPREMLASGDWIVPRLNGLRYFEKPVMGYWVTAVSMAVFGENAFALRFPFAAATGLTAFAIYLLLRTVRRNRAAPLLAVAVLLTFTEVYCVGTFGVLDSLLALWLTASLAAFYCGFQLEDQRKKNLLLAISGVCCGLAFLTKGFLAVAIPAIVIVPFLLWQRRLHDVFRLSWIPLTAAFLTALPWSLAIHFREPDFWNYFFWTEHFQRFTSDEAQHPEAGWFYIPVILAGALPGQRCFRPSPSATGPLEREILSFGLPGAGLFFHLCFFRYRGANLLPISCRVFHHWRL